MGWSGGKLSRWVIGLSAFLVLLAAFVVTRVKHQREVDDVSDTLKVARTLEIIRTSTASDPKVLKVLFYGQSITRSGWHELVVDHWHKVYPNTIFVVQNRALGGFPSQALVRTTEQDIAAFSPDLIIFHVYGDHRAYEQIIRLFRSHTAADIIVQTDHGEVLPDPPCSEGLQFTLFRKPGCSGFLWYYQRLWTDEMSYHKIPALAKKYGLAAEPQREWWRNYLLRTGTPAQNLLADNVHPNAEGRKLIAEFFNKYFDSLVARWKGEREGGVVDTRLTGAQLVDSQVTVSFIGNRLELISDSPLDRWPVISVDGKSPRDLDGCYQVSRASAIDTVPSWPALRRITLHHDHLTEQWTATLTNFSSDQKDFDFSIQGSISGFEGTGRGSQSFISKSGRLQMDSEDWMIERAWKQSRVPMHGSIEVHWSVDYVCDGRPEIINLGVGKKQYRYLICAGVSNGSHTVKFSLSAKELPKAAYFRSYQPVLRGSDTGWNSWSSAFGALFHSHDHKLTST
jgi:hypothetical protein